MAGKSEDPSAKASAPSGYSRRSLLKGVGVAAVASDALLSRIVKAADAIPGPEATALNTPISGTVKLTLNINDKDRQVTVEPRTTLLSALRDRLDPPLTGPKLVCNAGTCGACTVMINGKNVYGCSVLAVDAVGKKITTVEGIGTPDNLSPVQAAMTEKDGMMCGFCTSGFVTSITSLLKRNPNPSPEELRQGLKGNFCRCGTYPHVFEAAMTAAKNMNRTI
jgi:xanthine dehydrogenase YagT iron-sulfur-binding subunit